MRAAALVLICLALCGCYNVVVLNIGANHTMVLTGKLPPSELCGAALIEDTHRKLTREQIQLCSLIVKTPAPRPEAKP